jgi:uncharacterized protein YjbI with pentapeptide repeats
MRYLVLSVLVISLVGVLMGHTASSQEAIFPNWIKNNAGWWAEDKIPDSAFLKGIQYLIKEEIMIIPYTEMSVSSQSQEVPTWIKNTAGWWAEDKISEVEFVNAIEFLIKHRIITVNNGSSCASDLSETFGDSIAMVQDTCDFHESSQYSELLPFITEPNFNSHGFRGAEFSETKPSNTYRIIMIGGSTMFGSGESSDDTIIPGILQKIFDLDNSITQKIEVINAGISGGNSHNEFELLINLNNFQPDLVIVYDGWNDLKANYAVEGIANHWDTMCFVSNQNNFDIILTIQPIAGFGNKKLTQQENVNSLTGEDHYGFQLITAKSTYDYMGREMLSLQDNCNVVDLRGVFDDITGPIYWDQGHVSDTGNLILAEKFYEITNELIFNKKLTESKFHNITSKYNSPAITSYLLSKIGIDVDYDQIEKKDLAAKSKKDGNYFYLKNQLGGSGKILVGKDLSKTDLSKINLTGQNLSGANLSGQDLRKIDFTDTILRSANLSFTNLSGQDLSGMDLRGINFHNANLENADLSNITISKAVQYLDKPECHDPNNIFLDAVLTKRCVLEVLKNESIRTDFSNANMKGVIITISAPPGKIPFMHFVDFSGADLTGIDFSNLTFQACKFDGTNLNNSNMSQTGFHFCTFNDAKFNNSKFVNTYFHDVSFRNAEIIDGYFEKPIFIDVDFSNADLKGTLFDGITAIGNIVFNCKNNQICN